MGMSLSKLREFLMDREAWRAAIHGVTKSLTWLSDWTELNWYIKTSEVFGYLICEGNFTRKYLKSIQVQDSAVLSPNI